jgi:hypothetical protein
MQGVLVKPKAIIQDICVIAMALGDDFRQVTSTSYSFLVSNQSMIERN